MASWRDSLRGLERIVREEDDGQSEKGNAAMVVKHEKRWGQVRAFSLEEEEANLWAAKELISEQEWLELEEIHPESLVHISRALELPTAAALWRARAAEKITTGETLVEVKLNQTTVRLLSRSVNGQGGHQSFLRHLQKGLSGHILRLSRKDFNRIREYLLRTGGGYRARYQAIMNCVLSAIEQCGGIRKFFKELEA